MLLKTVFFRLWFNLLRLHRRQEHRNAPFTRWLSSIKCKYYIYSLIIYLRCGLTFCLSCMRACVCVCGVCWCWMHTVEYKYAPCARTTFMHVPTAICQFVKYKCIRTWNFEVCITCHTLWLCFKCVYPRYTRLFTVIDAIGFGPFISCIAKLFRRLSGNC